MDFEDIVTFGVSASCDGEVERMGTYAEVGERALCARFGKGLWSAIRCNT